MPPTAEVTAEVSPARSYPELFRVTGPLLSLVFRTEDVWQRYNQFIETAGALNQGFPFCISIKSNDHLTPTMQTGQDSDGGVHSMQAGQDSCLMIQPQALRCSKPSQLSLLFWGIVPCVYKIYTLDRFQFHGLLRNIPTRFGTSGDFVIGTSGGFVISFSGSYVLWRFISTSVVE